MKATDQSHLAPFCLFEMNGICAALTYVMIESDVNIQSNQFRSVRGIQCSQDVPSDATLLWTSDMSQCRHTVTYLSSSDSSFGIKNLQTSYYPAFRLICQSGDGDGGEL